MPRPAKGARLYLRERAGRESVWVIRDGSREISTGLCPSDSGAAEKAFSDYLAHKHTPDFSATDPERVLIADCLALYAEEAAPKQKRSDMVAGAIKNLVDFFGGDRVSRITPNVCRKYVDWRMAQPQARYTRAANPPLVGTASPRRELEILKAAFNHAYKERKLKYPIPVWLPDKSPPRLRWLTRSEVARLLWAARGGEGRHVAKFILLALYTGSRKMAVLGLRWEPSEDAGWIDLENRMLYRKGSREGETHKRRPPVPLSKRLIAHLRIWRRRAGGPNVIQWEGDPVDSVRRSWESARIRSGLSDDVTPHVLRHTFATWALHEGTPTSLAAEAMGVSEAIFRATYGHHASAPLRSVVEIVSGAKSGARALNRWT